jgi:hypothetical protein
MKIGRNQPCPCNSGKKYKHCHGHFSNEIGPADGPVVARMIQDLKVREHIRQRQQGLGKPIISTEFQGQRVVAIGNRITSSPKWKTFPDFLGDYIKQKLGGQWGNAEIAKPFAERHPLMQWYDALCRYQSKAIATPGKPFFMAVTGVVACYLGVAYGLYLLEHNVEIQARLLHRLKHPGQFQGAYYELLVASVLIIAGFKLTLEDETDADTKHCEFAAVALGSGKRYWVEAKMRGVAGELGRPSADGGSPNKPLSTMVKQLNAALAKPAADERMIFIDLNAEMSPNASEENRPAFFVAASRRLEEYERKDLPDGQRAYVFITNASYHKDLEAPAQLGALPFGLGIPTFNRAGFHRLSGYHRMQREHADAHSVASGFERLLQFPTTFDGSMPASTFAGERPPIKIGETYNFEGAGPNGEDVIGTVAHALVNEDDKTVTVAVDCRDGRSVLLKEPMSDAQLADYRSFPEAYFGEIVHVPKGIKTPQTCSNSCSTPIGACRAKTS